MFFGRHEWYTRGGVDGRSYQFLIIMQLSTCLFLLLLHLIAVVNCDDGKEAKLRAEFNQKFVNLSQEAKIVGVKVNAILDKKIPRDEMEKEFNDLAGSVEENVKKELETVRPTLNGKEITIEEFFHILGIY
ncbi:hypothetical protein PMAYCL1PPCAC_29791 [Pristionchus mayeri]|uniref:Uncharacterized protein n=1 Tax=Pristionchus mayeri TaxID=1317129 RepID=A0AAN5IEI4_9BILA|nr:hypothetical protein PMAYCL1PPCAC_29791 [Pristionchus mayeri]